MATLAISRQFLLEFAGLQSAVQKKVNALFQKFASDSRADALNLERLQSAADDRVRTVRIDRSYRGIVAAPEEGDCYILLSVKPHDDAYTWCRRNRIGLNELTNAVEVYDYQQLEVLAGQSKAEPSRTAILNGFSEGTLLELGVPIDLIPLLGRLETVDELIAFAAYLPTHIGDSVVALATGDPVDEIRERAKRGEASAGQKSPFKTALTSPESGSMFYVVRDSSELAEVLAQPLAFWRIFLHPSQRRSAYRESYSGPTRVLGGAGTGKTVTLLHRCHHLARRLPTGTDQPILVTTFTRNLAADLQQRLHELGGDATARRVQVHNIDAIILRFAREELGFRGGILTGADEGKMWQSVCEQTAKRFTPGFLAGEWHHVILAGAVASCEEYLGTARSGRGVPLSRRERLDAWACIQAFTDGLAEADLWTWSQLADRVAAHLRLLPHRPYRHVLVDEAQDLSPAHWRFLRAAVPQGADDIFIVGDAHQRIYEHRVVLSRVGIDVRGRSHRLRLNYRTTAENLKTATQILGDEQIDDLDGGIDSLKGYRSELHGPSPTVVGFASRDSEIRQVVAQVTDWIAKGVEPEAIAVSGRTQEICWSVLSGLQAAGVSAALIDPESGQADDAVGVATMHRMKGLEFRCVCLVDVGAADLPPAGSVADIRVDPVQHRKDLQRERNLVHVACTRARDLLHVYWVGEPSTILVESGVIGE